MYWLQLPDMRLCRSSILIISCLVIGFNPNRSFASISNQVPSKFKLVQATPNADSNERLLRPGNSGAEVKALQTKLKQLGLYTDDIDGDYGVSTRIAVSRFQAENKLAADGILGTTTRAKIDAAVLQKTQPTPTQTATATQKAPVNGNGERGLFWWALIGLGLLGTLGAIAYLLQKFSQPKREVAGFKAINSEVLTTDKDFSHEPEPKVMALPPQKQTIIQDVESLAEIEVHGETNLNGLHNGLHDPNVTKSELLAPETTSRLAKVNIVEELVKDLRSTDPNKRRKAIWDLGQQGDSRAIQPLVDIMIDADSQQRSLILAALSEIGTRTLKPMNRALAMSLQDESPEVRQNAIRDLTRVYDMMTQLSQMLYLATQDSDANVQATAKYALSQMNRIRSLAPDTSPEE